MDQLIINSQAVNERNEWKVLVTTAFKQLTIICTANMSNLSQHLWAENYGTDTNTIPTSEFIT